MDWARCCGRVLPSWPHLGLASDWSAMTIAKYGHQMTKWHECAPIDLRFHVISSSCRIAKLELGALALPVWTRKMHGYPLAISDCFWWRNPVPAGLVHIWVPNHLSSICASWTCLHTHTHHDLAAIPLVWHFKFPFPFGALPNWALSLQMVSFQKYLRNSFYQLHSSYQHLPPINLHSSFYQLYSIVHVTTHNSLWMTINHYDVNPGLINLKRFLSFEATVR